MQGFVNLAADLGHAIAVLIPLICYLVGGAFIIGAGWGFWQMTKSGSWFESKPWVPFVTLFTGATLLSFDRMLNFANNTIGGGKTTSLTAAQPDFTAPSVPSGTALLGATPGDTFTNIIMLFDVYFMSFGAFMVLVGVLGLKAVSEGRRRHGPSVALVQIVFGLLVMNVDTLAPGIMSYFSGTPAT